MGGRLIPGGANNVEKGIAPLRIRRRVEGQLLAVLGFGFHLRGLICRMWIVYALAAAIIWGISYAASGRVIERGLTPLVFFFLYTLFGAVAARGARAHG